MAKNDQEDAFERCLSSNLARVIDLVKFAEAKNAALLAFDSASAVAIANILNRTGGPPAAYADVLPIAGTLLIFSSVVALFSIMPRIALSRFYKREHRPERPLNLSFYGDIREVPLDKFPARIRERYLPPPSHSVTDAYLEDLSAQIHVNSAIADRKYSLFKVAGWITFTALLVLSLPGVLNVFRAAIHFLVGWAR